MENYKEHESENSKQHESENSKQHEMENSKQHEMDQLHPKDIFYYMIPIAQINNKLGKKLLSDRFYIKNSLTENTFIDALNDAGYKTNIDKIRKKIIKYINGLQAHNFVKLVERYKSEKESGKFNFKWDPFTIKNKRGFVNIIKGESQFDNYLISKAININFLILNDHLEFNYIGDENVDEKLEQPENLNEPEKIIILYQENDKYKVVSYHSKSKNKKKMILKEPYPDEINILLPQNYRAFIKKHIKEIYDNTDDLVLNDTLNKIKDICSFDENECVVMFNEYLDEMDYFLN
jgi:hypothetical protein